jgi:Outer membrane receptor proteins, mostly Fe transport
MSLILLRFFSIFLFTLSFSFMIFSNLSAQDNVTLSGYVKDQANGETLIGATIFLKEIEKGATTNVYGFYSISVPPENYSLEVSYLGFNKLSLNINLNENQKLNLEMVEESSDIEEIVVVAEREDQNVTNNEISTQKLGIATIQKMPALLGEVDIIRSIQLLPGVSTVGEGATGFNVRGGSIDQNLVLLDESPVYNSSHLFGFFSVFNPDAVKDVKLYKGGIPARYGGRLSSILDVRMKEGNNKKLSIKGGVGFIFSRLSVEAPFAKGKGSFIVAGRRSYIDILAKPFLNDDLSDTELNFYDLTFKTNYTINDRNRVFFSGYNGRDNFRFGEDAGFNWGNNTLSLRWNHLFSDRLFSNITLYRSRYDYELAFGGEADNRFDWNASILNYAFKPELSFYLNPDNLITFGGQSIYYTFEPGNAVGVSEGESTDISLDKKFAWENSIYIENEQTLNDRFSLNYGLRFSHFNYLGEGTKFIFEENGLGERKTPTGVEFFESGESIQTYQNFEPRLSAKFQLDQKTSLKLGYNRTAQYLHLISNSTASTPVDVWTPSTNNIEPQIADQIGLGLFKNFKNNAFETSIEVYYKDYRNLTEYIEGANLFLNQFLEGELVNGVGRAYGIELYAEKKKGKFTGWVSYTFSRTERRVDGINRSEWFPSRFDQPHSLSVTGFYDVGKRWTLSANFVLNSGTPATFPTSRIEQQGYVIPYNSLESRNNVRIPAYHRLDLAATLKPKEKEGKRFRSEWVFGVYNAYNRRNPFTIFFRQDQNRALANVPVNTEAVRFSVVGNFIPSVSWNFKFN